jgi:GNAT superfamily N-acetyltransferase
VSDFTVQTTEDLAPEDRATVIDGLVSYNRDQGFVWERAPLNVLAREAEGRVIGGLLGEINLGWLFVTALWVDADHRGADIGTELIHAAEVEARARQCVGVYLDTYSFQARPFYQKLGFELFGELSECPPGGAKYYFRKQFVSPHA